MKSMPELIVDDGTANRNKVKICKESTRVSNICTLSMEFSDDAFKFRARTYSLKEFLEVFVHNGPDYFTIHISKPNTQHCANNKQYGKEVHVLGFLACVSRDGMLD